MAFKDILFVLTTYPDPTPVSAVDEPIAFAVAFGSRISAIACEVKFRVPRNILLGRCSMFQRWLLPRPRRVRRTRKNFWSHFKALRKNSGSFKNALWSIV